MAQRTFIEMLEAMWAEGRYGCVGLDPMAEKLPEELASYARHNPTEEIPYALGEAMVRIIDATKDIAAAYKPNTAFYECYGIPGWRALERVVKHGKEAGVPVILDAKRGDIGATNERYAAMAFDHLGADAITIHPYLGWQANQPFLDRADKGVFVLCRTSNPGAGEFQDYEVLLTPDSMKMRNGETGADITGGTKIVSRLFRRVADHVSYPETWNRNGNCGLVAGATYPEEIREIRAITENLPLLIPGIGKQGGDLEASVRAARHRFLINSSSGIIFADDPRAETLKLHEGIQSALANIR